MTDHAVNEWTRDDLPSVIKSHRYGNMHFSRIQEVEAYKDDVVDHLNAHHPKPEQTMVPARPVSPEERGELWALIRDELRGVYSSTTDQDHRKLDLAASASADTAVEYLNDRGGLGIDAREPLERALRERDAAESRTAPAVTRDDIEKAILSRRWNTSGPDSQGFDIIHIQSATDAVCDLFGIEDEQAADPVEELAGQIESATRAAIRQVCVDLADVAPSLDPLAVEQAMEVMAASRKVAAHVLGQGAGHE